MSRYEKDFDTRKLVIDIIENAKYKKAMEFNDSFTFFFVDKVGCELTIDEERFSIRGASGFKYIEQFHSETFNAFDYAVDYSGWDL